MKLLLPILAQVFGVIAVLGFIAASAAHGLLCFYLDRRRAKGELSSLDGNWIIQTLAAPVEFYRREGRAIWWIRDKGLKSFAICVGLLALIIGEAAVADIPLGL